jgi:hypothetical protein
MSDTVSKPASSSTPTVTAMAQQLPPRTPPDAVVTQGKGAFVCSVAPEALADIRQRAGRLIWKAGETAYAHFPIDRKDLYRKMIGGMLTERNICQTLVPPKISEKDHNDIREQYKSERLSSEAGAGVGMVGVRLPLKASCPESYDWENSPVYAGAESCEDVTEEFAGRGIPTALYSTALPAADAIAFLSAPATAPFYTRYANEGPVPCTCDSGGNAFFHAISVWGTLSAEFAMRTFRGESWSAWSLASECTTPDGKAHHPTDIMFDFGVRIFVPIEVDIDGERATRTLVLAQVAATSEGFLAKLIPSQIPLERFFGGEYAKKVLTEARARNWKIEKKK